MKKSGVNFKLVKILMTLAVTCMMSLTTGSKSEAASAPAQVTGLRQTGASENSVYLKWNKVASNDKDYSIDYEIYASTDKRNWVRKGAAGGKNTYISG